MSLSRSNPDGGLSIVALYQYQVARVHELLWAAAKEIEFRGDITKGVHYDPEDDLVDAFGAICLAAGAEPKKILSHGDDLDSFVAPAQVPKVLTAVDAIEGWFGEDINTWSDRREASEVAAGLRFVANKISIAVRL